MEDFRVLVVDDEEEFLNHLVKRLKQRELDVRGVLSGEEAIASIRQKPVEVVVLDVRMPGMDGIETLKEIKKIDPLVEVIILTGYADSDTAVEVMELGAFDYLMKPMDLDDLIYKIQDAYQNRQFRQKSSLNEDA